MSGGVRLTGSVSDTSDADNNAEHEGESDAGEDEEVERHRQYIGLKNNREATLCPVIAVLQLLYHHPLYRSAVDARSPLHQSMARNESAKSALEELKRLFDGCVNPNSPDDQWKVPWVFFFCGVCHLLLVTVL
eukprot:TRINITY_DN312_c0_g1_i26.p2 TRINITY_DN312_c0_g1~~TRINITY_DN312_c0_g1_i26.p2  ORF type:complete len:133 (+),score=18.90 TRINITY_DN312_c0_g1_i26:342-740(+)